MAKEKEVIEVVFLRSPRGDQVTVAAGDADLYVAGGYILAGGSVGKPIEKMTKAELLELAAAKGITVDESLKKDELIEAVQAVQDAD